MIGDVRGPRPRPAGVPLADVALVIFAVVACAGIFSAVRGVGIRFEASEAGRPPVRDLWVRVLADGTARVDGERVAAAALATTVRRRVGAEPSLRCVVHVVPEASYQTAVDALARLADACPLNLPTQRDVEAYVAAAGRDPFEGGER